jgi:putative holliday junction resolvase
MYESPLVAGPNSRHDGSMTSQIPAHPRGRLAGIDYGTVRIGIALTDREQQWVSPWKVYTRVNKARDAEFFRAFVHEEQIVQLVVGLPLHLSGDESAKSYESRQFGEWLGQETSIPVIYFDERFSSLEAEQMLGARQKMTRKQKKRRLDAVAAQVLLQAYLEWRASGS